MQKYRQFCDFLASHQCKKTNNVWDKEPNFIDQMGGFHTKTSGAYYVPSNEVETLLTLKFQSRKYSHQCTLIPRWNDIRPLTFDLDKFEIRNFEETFKQIDVRVKKWFPDQKYVTFIEKNQSKEAYHVIYYKLFVNEEISRTVYAQINEELGAGTTDPAIAITCIRQPDTLKKDYEKEDPDGRKTSQVPHTDYRPIKNRMDLKLYLGPRNLLRTGVLAKPSKHLRLLIKKYDKKLKKEMSVNDECWSDSVKKYLKVNYPNKKFRSKLGSTVTWELPGTACPRKGSCHKRKKTLLVYIMDRGIIGLTCDDRKEDCPNNWQTVFYDPEYNEFDGCVIDSDDEDDFIIDDIFTNDFLEEATEFQLAEALERYFKKDIVRVGSKIWYIWNTKRNIWELSNPDELSTFILRFFAKKYTGTDDKVRRRLGSDAHGKKVVSIMSGFSKNTEFLKGLDQNRSILSIKNRVVDLRKGVVRERRRSDALSYELPVKYKKKNIEMPFKKTELGKFLNDIFKYRPNRQGHIDFLQRFLGLCLTGEVEDQKFVVWLGKKGANGKGLLVDLMKEILGRKMVNLEKSDVIKGRSTFLQKRSDLVFAKCAQANLAIVNETNQGEQLEEALIKRMTGLNNNEHVNCKWLFKDQVDMPMFFKCLFSTNFMPEFDGTDEALIRRLIVLKFDRYYRDVDDHDYDPNDIYCGVRDRHVLKRIRKEGLFLQWVIEGAKKYYETGLNPPKEMLYDRDTQVVDNDELGTWLKEILERSTKKDDVVLQDTLFFKYQEDDMGMLCKKMFAKELSKRGMSSNRKRVNGIRKFMYVGYKIKEEAKDDQ